MIILDIDNCIADDSWRIHLIDEKRQRIDDRYHAYHMLSLFDNAHHRHVWEGRNDIIIMTSRPEIHEDLTTRWLLANGVQFELLIMRGNGDYRSTQYLKQRAAVDLRMAGHHIDHAYDDREDIVAAYQDAGIPASVLKIHEGRKLWDSQTP